MRDNNWLVFATEYLGLHWWYAPDMGNPVPLGHSHQCNVDLELLREVCDNNKKRLFNHEGVRYVVVKRGEFYVP